MKQDNKSKLLSSSYLSGVAALAMLSAGVGLSTISNSANAYYNPVDSGYEEVEYQYADENNDTMADGDKTYTFTSGDCKGESITCPVKKVGVCEVVIQYDSNGNERRRTATAVCRK